MYVYHIYNFPKALSHPHISRAQFDRVIFHREHPFSGQVSKKISFAHFSRQIPPLKGISKKNLSPSRNLLALGRDSEQLPT